jgi:hypothetical protein
MRVLSVRRLSLGVIATCDRNASIAPTKFDALPNAQPIESQYCVIEVLSSRSITKYSRPFGVLPASNTRRIFLAFALSFSAQRSLALPRNCDASLMGGYYDQNEDRRCKRDNGVGHLLIV